MINLIVKKVTVLRLKSGTDKINFDIEGPTPFPEMQAQFPNEDHSPHCQLECRRGYAETWLKLMGFTDYHIIFE